MTRKLREDRPRKKIRRGLGNRAHQPRAEDQVALAELRERRKRAWELRSIQKLTVAQIAEELGVGETAVREYIKAVLAEIRPDVEQVEQVRAEEEETLRRLSREVLLGSRTIVARFARAGEFGPDGKPLVSHEEVVELLDRLPRYLREATRISESRRRLHGANAPVKIEVEGEVLQKHAVVTFTLADAVRAAARNAGEEPPAALAGLLGEGAGKKGERGLPQ